MEHLLDAIGVLGNISSHILTILALLGIVLGMGRVKAFQKQLDQVIKTVMLIGAATLDENGRPLIDPQVFGEMKKTVEDVKGFIQEHSIQSIRHFDDSARAASEDKFKNCDVQKCVHIKEISHQISRIHDRFDQFDRRAEDSRGQTSASLQTISQGQKDLGAELGSLAKTIITVLSDIIRERIR